MTSVFMVILAFIFISGLCIGSFLNVVILRTVSGESIVFPNSKCPKCQTSLKWYHNIPLLSFIFLRGKCAFCHAKISIQYPIVELFTGIIFTVLGYLYLINSQNNKINIFIPILMFFMSVIFSSLLIVVSGTDIKEMKVSDKHTYSLIATGLIYSLIIGVLIFITDYKYGGFHWQGLFQPILYTLFAIIIAFLFMEILRRGLNYIMQTETFGDGDSYIFSGIAGYLTALSGMTDLKFISLCILSLFAVSIIISVIFSFPAYVIRLIKNKNWAVLSVLAIFTIYTPLYFYLGYHGLYDNTILLTICTLLLVIIGITLCVLIVRGISENKEKTMVIPFGPALCCSGLAALTLIPHFLGLI